jgi:hypothetical protein
MQIVSVEKIDGFGGLVLPGEPERGDIVRITYDTGVIRERYYYPPPDDPTQLTQRYIHVLLSGAAGNPPAFGADGVDTITLTISVRTGIEPDSPVVTGINAKWDLPVRNTDNVVHDWLYFDFVNGEATVDYSTTRSGRLAIMAADADIVLGSTHYSLITAPQFLAYYKR